MSKEKLSLWQERLSVNETAYNDEYVRMDEREALYAGDRGLESMVEDDLKSTSPLVHNVIAEVIEAMEIGRASCRERV